MQMRIITSTRSTRDPPIAAEMMITMTGGEEESSDDSEYDKRTKWLIPDV